MTRSLYILLCLLVALCSCNDAKKLQWILERHPEWRDTVVIHDTVTAIVEYVRHDTTFVPVAGDTVRIDDGRLHVRYVRMPGDTVYLEGECDPDTVMKVVEHEVPVYQPATEKKVEVIPWWVKLVIGGLVAAVVIIAIKK